MTGFTGFTARLSAGWQARQPRERVMLAVMAVSIGAFAYWYGGVAPLRNLAASARADHERSAARLAVVRGHLVAVREARAAAPALPDGDAYAAILLDTASAAGISVSRQRARGAGGLAVGIDAVDAAPLFSWLDTLRSVHGIAPDVVDIGRRDGRLHAEVAFPGPRDEPQRN